MSQERMIRQMLAQRAAGGFLRAVAAMADANPHPNGAAIRLTAVVIDGGLEMGSVDVDVTNLEELGYRAVARAAAPVPSRPVASSRPALHVVGGGA